MNDNSLFLVWNPNANFPRYRHYSRDSAIREARRLADANPGEQFFVMAPVGLAVRRDPVEWIEADDIPF